MAYRIDFINWPHFKYTSEDAQRFAHVRKVLKETSRMHGVDLLSGIPAPQLPMPEKAFIRKPIGRHPIDHNRLPDEPIYDIMRSHFGWIISERCRNLIEELEPQTHKFIPFRIIGIDGKDIPGRFWILNICNLVDAFAAELCEHTKRLSPRALDPDDWQYHPANQPDKNFFLWKAKVHGKMLWSDRRFYRNRVFVSDLFNTEVSKMGRNILKHKSHIHEITVSKMH